MTQDEIIEMARQSGFMPAHDNRVQHFAKLVEEAAVSKEREACALVCDDIHAKHETEDTFSTYADAIRARGQA
jgi:hypothetical protein